MHKIIHTAKGVGSPRLNLDILSLAGCGISSDGLTKNIWVSLVCAGVKDTIFKEVYWVNCPVTWSKRSIAFGEDPTVTFYLVSSFLSLTAFLAFTGASCRTPGDILHFQAVCKLCYISGLTSILHVKIIMTILVGVATESIDRIGVRTGKNDPGVAGPVKRDCQIEIGLNEAMSPTPVDS